VIPLVKSPFFTTNELKLTKSFVRNYTGIDSFRVYMCLSGECAFLSPEGQGIFLHAGESLVVPASTSSVTIVPDEQAKLLESYVE
jgi:mannose-6-phosphate isomerase